MPRKRPAADTPEKIKRVTTGSQFPTTPTANTNGSHVSLSSIHPQKLNFEVEGESTLFQTINERILQRIRDYYISEEFGLEKLAQRHNVSGVVAPPSRITCLILGNHSAGKSSLINWYIEDSIQKVSVAMETMKFTLVTSGKRRETLTGATVMEYWPRIGEALKGVYGIPEYLQAEVSTSKERLFPLVNFIDTPGLVDGPLTYPYNVEEILIRLAKLADLIFILFDPIGKAGCERSVKVAEALVNDPATSEKVHFYLAKADELTDALDRQKVLIQITQTLAKNINTVNFDLPTIFIPRVEAAEQQKNIPNSIESFCQEIERTINQTVQRAIASLEADAKKILQAIDEKLEANRKQKLANRDARLRTAFWITVTAMTFILLLLCLSSSLRAVAGIATRLDTISMLSGLGTTIDSALQGDLQKALVSILAVALVVSMGFFYLNKRRIKPVLSSKEIVQLEEERKKIAEVLERKSELYQMYFTSIRTE